jgi:23S rRNA C2498 (ribose-2'-O)-methylase RlmM
MVASMAVMAKEGWTDERLDDLKENVNQRFDEVDKRFDRVETEMRVGFAETNRRLDAMQRTIIVCFSGMTVSIVGLILATQL